MNKPADGKAYIRLYVRVDGLMRSIGVVPWTEATRTIIKGTYDAVAVPGESDSYVETLELRSVGRIKIGGKIHRTLES